ncbi:uncharacterized protein LOC108152263 isoform X1 [Drosophila miranda]|uniref:uncharacterized protein LOC108152263 isoform X1 n=1 Tax=Drosophila miranda TaxID=7229 RepID=UPI0007E60F59|nr:uncharacterized protein LOC108152263 isoform X1 [Drosophila miranda]XP_017136962.1 uncharacterized protein LOC108152263 isoform X1 [Drosophila miranda]XP_017136963.1 uncharacterized protein LOC108152263 isoform X1 [Drosophila miranda]XP_017136964.1 uncharacterized protein LOC108152263 isoform X1 [Drosophila miranda]
MDSLKLPKASSATSSASGSNSNLSGSTSASASAATSPTSSNAACGGMTTASSSKSPPGLSNSSTPITVRFNANDESLDDILQSFHQNKHSPSGGASGGGDASPTLLGMKNNGMGLNAAGMTCDSLSSSPSHQQMQAALFSNEEVNLRNNYMQGGGFFNRKRSGSIEGVSPTSSGPNLIAALTAAGISSGGGGGVGGPTVDTSGGVGTWKLIKGKVTQTLEEIKSSKHPSHHSTAIPAIPIIVADPPSIGWSPTEPDSDTECIPSLSEDLPLDPDHKQHHQQNSDSDAEAEQLQHDSSSLGSGDVAAAAAVPIAGAERSRLRRGLAHIKSKVKAKHQAAAMSKKDISHSPSAPSGSLRSGFLRRRNVVDVGSEPSTLQQAAGASAEIPIASGKVKKRSILLARKDVEIESGVEVLEDMIPMANKQAGFPVEWPEMGPADDRDGGSKGDEADPRASFTLPFASPEATVSFDERPPDSPESMSWFSFLSRGSNVSLSGWRRHRGTVSSIATPIALGASIVVLMILPMQDFLRGVFATMLFIALIDSCGKHLRWVFEHFMLSTHPERVKFRIPNYEAMPICKIPSAEEHKTIKTYSGWMNELDSYDPLTFSFHMTRSIYVRLDGCILKMSGTQARIPKRSMWNEQPIDRKKILFTDHRSYDLRDCRIELLPLGLAKKRFFNRKYPIQLIIKNTSDSPTARLSTESLSDSTLRLESNEARTSLTFAPGSTPPYEDQEKQDFAATVMQGDLQQLRNNVNPDTELNDITVPCGDEVRLLLFTRCDREKEDWYRRFIAASKGRVHEQDLHVPMARFVEDTDLQMAAARQAVRMVGAMGGLKARPKDNQSDDRSLGDVSFASNVNDGQQTPDVEFDEITADDLLPETPKEEQFEGMIMSSDVARNPADYVRFMAGYQKACRQTQIPVTKTARRENGSEKKKNRRAKRQEDELWKGVDQSLFLGPSGSIVWANVLMGRCLFSMLHDAKLQERIKEFMQKKLNSIKLPSFMEEVIITNIYMGDSPMLCHRVSQPMLDERGVWVDADLTYEGLAHITVTTKLNLLRIRAKTKASPMGAESGPSTSAQPDLPQYPRNLGDDDIPIDSRSAIYDSDGESTGGSSTESESPPTGAATETASGTEFFQNSPGNARRIFKIVDRIAASNLFQYATELPYVQRAMENMNANITLRVDLKGMVARGTINIPPPPSDRVWVCFRGPPRLWISTKPQVGDKSVDWSIVTNVIESKLCEAVNKFLVYPNMVDFNIPFLAKPSYEDESPASPN